MTSDDPRLPPSLAVAQRRFAEWRSTRQQPCRIPPALWKAAVRCASKHGVWHTVRALGLDYSCLKKRVMAAGDPGARTRPQAFVELVAPPSPGEPAECVLEVERPGGAKLRVECRGTAVPDLADLARSFAVEGA